MSDSNPSAMGRREFLGAAGLAAAATGLAATSTASAATAVKFNNTMDFTSPEWNRDAYARLQGDLDFSKTRYGWLGGPVMGVVPGEKVRVLFTMEGFSTCRLIPIEGGYRKLLRELVVYKDPQTGRILDTWVNPYTNEEVKVVPIFNDPFNYNITLTYPEPPSFGGLNKEKPPARPFILPWQIKGSMLLLSTDIHLYYPNALQPDKWPRESAGKLVQVTELYRYFIRLEDMKNPALTQVPCWGVWGRITPWLPWMLMGTAPGHTVYSVDFTGADSPAHVSPEFMAFIRERYPQVLTPPDSDYGPSLSSLENYAKFQTPAPPKAPSATPAPAPAPQGPPPK